MGSPGDNSASRSSSSSAETDSPSPTKSGHDNTPAGAVFFMETTHLSSESSSRTSAIIAW
jgi:hypothetical protein